MQGNKVVGVHVRGIQTSQGAVINSGFALLTHLGTRQETSSKAAQLAWQYEQDADHSAEDGWEEIDDFLDYSAAKRGGRVLFTGKKAVAVSTAKLPWKPIGISWADMTEDEFGSSMEQGNGPPAQKTSAQATKEASTSSQRQQSEQPCSGQASVQMTIRPQRSQQASSNSVRSVSFAPTPRLNSSASSSLQPSSSQSLESGELPTAALVQSEAVSSGKQTHVTTPKASSQRKPMSSLPSSAPDIQPATTSPSLAALEQLITTALAQLAALKEQQSAIAGVTKTSGKKKSRKPSASST